MHGIVRIVREDGVPIGERCEGCGQRWEDLYRHTVKAEIVMEVEVTYTDGSSKVDPKEIDSILVVLGAIMASSLEEDGELVEMQVNKARAGAKKVVNVWTSEED